MNDVWLRLGLIVVVLAAAGAIVLLQRRRTQRAVRSVDTGALEPGVYFFSAESCPTCARAREKLDDALGVSGYREVVWERNQKPFEELGIDAVPSVLVVDRVGRGRVYAGQPDRALAAR